MAGVVEVVEVAEMAERGQPRSKRTPDGNKDRIEITVVDHGATATTETAAIAVTTVSRATDRRAQRTRIQFFHNKLPPGPTLREAFG